LSSSTLYQELLRRNRLLEIEVARLKASVNASSTGGLSPSPSSVGSVPEGNGFIDSPRTADGLAYPGHDVYDYSMPASNFVTGTAEIQHTAVTAFTDNRHLHVPMDCLDTRACTMMSKASTNCVPVTSAAGTYHHVDQGGMSVYEADTSTNKFEYLQSNMYAGNGMWNLGQAQDCHHREGHCDLQNGTLPGPELQDYPAYKTELKCHQAGDYYVGDSPKLQYSESVVPRHSIPQVGQIRHHSYSSACN
jgi:hypothetical protein